MSPAKADPSPHSKSVDLSVRGIVAILTKASPQVFWAFVFGLFWWFVAKPMIDQNNTERNQMYTATAAIDRASIAVLKAAEANERSSEYNAATAKVQERIMSGLLQVSEHIGRLQAGYLQGRNSAGEK